MAFTNPFFSLAGQAERLSNAGNTILSALTGKGVEATTSIKPLNTALSTVASNPYLSAAAVATVVNPAGAVAAIKEVAGAASTAFKAAPLATKAKVTVATGLIAPLIIAQPGKTAQTIAEAPGNIVNFESNLVSFYKNPSLSSAKDIFKENPVIAGGAAVAAVAATGIGLAGTANTVATFMNTQAMKANTKATILNAEDTAGAIAAKNNDLAAAAPVLSTQSKEAVPGAKLTSTPLKAQPSTSKKAASKSKRGRRKHKIFKGKNKCKLKNGYPLKCYNFY